MPITLFTGRAGTGKSLRMADEILHILKRNQKWYKRTSILRRVYSNLRLNSELEYKYQDFIRYWDDPEELVQLRDCDIFWDEMATHVDANQYKEMPLELKRWIQQHRKLGIEIWGTTQDFAQIDKSFRRLTDKIFYQVKLLGSRDISPTKPPPKFVWGLIIVRTINPTDYNEDDKGSQANGFSPFFITRTRTAVFDTTQEIKPGNYPSLRHAVRRCDTCGYEKILHS